MLMVHVGRKRRSNNHGSTSCFSFFPMFFIFFELISWPGWCLFLFSLSFYSLLLGWCGNWFQNRPTVGSMRVKGNWVVPISVSFFFLLFFQFCFSSLMTSSVAQVGVRDFTLYLLLPSFFFTLLTCLSLALMRTGLGICLINIYYY